MMIEGNSHTVSRAADGDPAIHLTAFHSIGKRMGKIRIITAFRRIGTEIHHFVSLSEKVADELVLILHTGVVATYSNFHIAKIKVTPKESCSAPALKPRVLR